MKIDAALVVRRRVRKIVSQSRDRRHLIPVLSIEIGVTTTKIDGAVPRSNIRYVVFAIEPDRDVTCSINHEIADILIPFSRRTRIQVTKARHRLTGTSAQGIAPRTSQCRRYAVTHKCGDSRHGQHQLRAENRCRKRITRRYLYQVGSWPEASDNAPTLFKFRAAFGRGCCVIIRRRPLESRLNRNSRETSERAW